MMGMGQEDVLSKLRDIHTPPPPGAWPPGPGWGFLLAFLLIMAGLTPILLRFFRRATVRTVAVRELARLKDLYAADQDMKEFAEGLSILCKRVALVRFDRETVAVLHGDEWATFLRETAPPSSYGGDELLRLIANAPYAPESRYRSLSDKYPQMLAVVENWIRHNC